MFLNEAEVLQHLLVDKSQEVIHLFCLSLRPLQYLSAGLSLLWQLS